MSGLLSTAAVLILVVAVATSEPETVEVTEAVDPVPTQAESVAPEEAETTAESEEPVTPSSASAASATPNESTRTKEPKPKRRTFLVVRAVDGDTIELGNGQTVRVIGIDTPERGECDYGAASQAMVGLVVGERVELTRVDEDTDRYGRILRYVDVAGTDAGFELIKRGLAMARYDSRDGYGFHPREPRYIRADHAKPRRNCALKPQPSPTPNGVSGANCASGYSPCVPSYPPDVNCADVNGPINVTGADPHGLDRDGDGVACE